MAKRKFYVVWEGRQPGIYDNWDDCQQQVALFPGARFKAFNSQDAATAAFRGDPEAEEGIIRAIALHNSEVATASELDTIAGQLAAFPEINARAWAVDGACSGVPGPMEYRCVDIATGRQVFHHGPVEGGTNNAAEYLALVHALALLYNRNDGITPIYSDSRTARAWVRDRRNRCTLPRTPEHACVYNLLDRADLWLQTHRTTNPILVWNTALWGEIPADFHRK
ncbi:MAG: ribonuclease H family protein [Muribaculaceae bacterium]|nr:ribonuclease H family protein [Muribaculaceae bacterium]